MKVNFNKPIVGIAGHPLVLQEEALTIKSVVLNSLHSFKSDKPEEMLKCYDLATKINSDGEVDVTIDEAKLIQDTVAMYNSTLIYGQVYYFFNSKE